MSGAASSSRSECTTVTFAAPYRVALQRQPLPTPGPSELLVATEASAISPGSELLFYRGQAPSDMAVDSTIAGLRDATVSYPISYGYACVGRVTAVGSESLQRWLGRRIFAFHPHASHFTVAAGDALPVPADLSPEDAALLPNMETAVNFVMDGEPVIGERVAVMGQGVVGLLTTALLARFPLAELMTVDPIAERRRLSQAMGATRALTPESAAALSDFDLVYELSGNARALDQTIALAGYGSRVVIGSWYGAKEVRLNLGGEFHRSRIRLISSQVSTIDPRWSGRWSKTRRFQLTWRMLGEINIDALITHRLPVEDAARAYELLDQHPGEALQIILNY